MRKWFGYRGVSYQFRKRFGYQYFNFFGAQVIWLLSGFPQVIQLPSKENTGNQIGIGSSLHSVTKSFTQTKKKSVAKSLAGLVIYIYMYV